MSVKFLYLNLFDDGELIASHSAIGYPVSNIQLRWHTRTWRSTGQINTSFINNLLGEKDIKALVIKHHNFLTGANVHIQATNNEGVWTFLDEALTVVAGKPIVKFWETAQSFQWWRLFMAVANPTGYDEIGRMFLGDYSTITRPISLGFAHELIDPSNVLHSSGGQLSSNPLTKYKRLTYGFRGLVAADLVTLKAIFASVGQHVPYFFCEVSDGSVTYYVRNASPWSIINMVGELYDLEINLEELR